MVAFATQVKRRRGTTAQNDAFTGAEGEIVVDTQKHTLRVHDGETQGGFEMATQADLNNKADTSYIDGLLATKANTDLGNIPTNYDYVVESQEPTAENDYTWYRKYKSGWVEQGGIKEITLAVNGADTVIKLPVAMSTSYYTIGVTLAGRYGGRTISAQKNKATTTTITVGGYVNSGTESNSCYWQVSGYEA